MRRGYRRERRADAPLDEQDRALRAAGVSFDGSHPPLYTDTIKDTGSNKPLAELLRAIRSLRNRDEDEIVVYDAATIGRNHQEIVEGLAAIGRTGCKLIICTPVMREFVWHTDAAEIAAVAAEGDTILRSAKGKVSANKHLGAAPKLVGDVMVAAKAAWADPSLTARAAVAKVFEVTGVKISARLLFSKLGNKSTAELRMLQPPMPKPSKPKPKRRKAKRKVKVTA
jgi:hypothetical protein